MAEIKNKSGITRTFTCIAVLTSVGCLAVSLLLPAQAQSILAPSIASFQADAPSPSLLIQTKPLEHRIALSLDEDFSPSSPFVLLKDYPPADRPSVLQNIHVGYGQFFPAQNDGYHDISRIKPLSRLYLKFSFKF